MAVVNINRNQFEEMVHSGNAVLDRNQRPTRDVGNQYIR